MLDLQRPVVVSSSESEAELPSSGLSIKVSKG